MLKPKKKEDDRQPAGIGEDVDERLLLRIVNNCRGNYTRVTDLKLLVEWYADLARDLKMISTLEVMPDFVPDDVPGEVEPVTRTEAAGGEVIPEPQAETRDDSAPGSQGGGEGSE